MLTLFLMFVAAYVAIVFDSYILDLRYGYTEGVTYYLTQPWDTVKRATVVAKMLAAEAWAKLAD